MLQSVPIKSTVRSLILLFSFLLLTIVGYSQASDSLWLQTYSELPDGYSVAMSDDASLIAVGDPFYSDNSSGLQYNGQIIVYRKDQNGFTELDRISGSEDNGRLGGEIKMNASGSRIVSAGLVYTDNAESGAPIRGGGVSVFNLNLEDSTYVLLGQKLTGSDIFSGHGISIDITQIGDTIALGEFQYSIESFQSNDGRAQVFYYNGSNWVKIGGDIVGAQNVKLGSAVALSRDGSRLAVGSKQGGNNFSGGEVTVYDLVSGVWTQVGMTLAENETTDLSYFGSSIDLSLDGNVMAVGTGERKEQPSQNPPTRDGYVKVFEFDGTDWNQKGSTLTADGSGDVFGYRVVLSDVGDRLAISAPWFDVIDSDENGQVKVFDFETDDWVLVVDQFIADSLVSNIERYGYGYDVDMNGNGTSVIITQAFGIQRKVEVFDLVSELEAPQVVESPTDRTILDLPIIFNWLDAYPEETSATVHISLNSDFSDTVYFKEGIEPLIEGRLEAEALKYTHGDTLTLADSIYAGETYFWRIRKQAPGEGEAILISDWTEGSFSVDPIDVPIIESEDQITVEPPFSLEWSAETDPENFQFNFQLSTQADFSDTLRLELNYTESVYAIDFLDTLNQDTYFWRVRRQLSVADDRFSDWASQSFTVDVPGVSPLHPESGLELELPATLAWQPESANTEDYDFEVQISLSESFADTLLYEEGVQDTTLIVDFDFERELGETYFWRARRVGTENSTYASEWSTIQSFSTKIDAPEVEGPQGDTIELPYNFTWLPDTLDAFYDYNLVIYSDEELSDSLIVYTINNGTSQVISPTDGESAFLFRSDSTYYWNLARFANQNNSLRSEPTPTYSFRTKVDNATILSPTMGDTINPAFTGFTWDQSNLENIEDYVYEMRIADTVDFTDPILIDGPINGSNHSPEVIFQADTSKLYYWGIRRFANGNDFLISDFAVDSVVFQINAPELVGPEEGTDIILGQTPVTLQWFDATGGDPNLDYYLQVSEFRNFSNPIVDQEVEGGFFTLDNNDLETNETYYWRVRVAWNQGGVAPEFHMSSRWSTSSFFVYPDYIRLIPDSVFVVEPNYVNVMLHALDGENEGITVLEQDDFELLENDSPISPTESRYQVSKLDQIPSNLQTVLMLDNSLSIGEDNLDSIKNAARSFIRNKAEDQEISIFVFADMVENVIDFSTDTTALLSAIDNIVLTQFSGTDLYSATLTGLAAMENKFSLTQIQQSFMLLFTDGKDLAGRATLDSVLNARGNKQIYAVGVKLNEADFDEPTLRQIGNAATFVDEGFSELIGRFEEVQENSLLFANSFYWLNYASSRRAGLTDLTAQMVENTNVNEDRRIVTTFDADGFYSAPIDIVIDGTAEVPLGVDTIRMAGDATQKVKIESVFAYAAYPFSFDISDPTRLQIVPDIENAFNYDFYADGEAEDTVRLTIADTVQQTLNLEKTLVIIYTDRETSFNEAPEIENQTFSLEENSEIGILVGAIVATDPEGDPLTYAILSGNEGDAFSLDESSGELTVANEAAIDFETTPTFILTIEVTDTEPKSNTAEITVNLTDVFENQAPVFEAQVFTINEHSPIGTVVGELEASDAENDELTFTIESGNESGLFALDNANGNITVANSENLDFELVQQVILQVIVSDGDLSTEAAITIDLIDVDENINQPPAINDQQFSILLSSSTGEIIGTVNASDPNGDELTFSIINGNDAGVFTIDATNGELSILDATNLTETSYTLTVDVSDGELNSSASITIEVTDENFAPEISDQSFTISASATNGDQVGTVVASDPNNDNLVFSIDDGNTNGIFVINSSTGIISISNESALSVNEFSLTVSVFDGDLSAEATITINVVEVNDPPTVDDQTFTIDENSAAGTTVGTISTSDPENDPLIFSIVSGNESGSFEIGEDNGVLSVLSSSALDFETTPTFTLGIEVNDGLNTVSATITINLNDVEDSGQLPPQIENQTFSVDENSPNGTVVGTVVATDPENNTIFFGIVSGNENGEFGIGLNDGVLTVENSNELDYEVNPVFDLVVEAGDGDKLNTAIITINLNDLDDNDPPQIENQTFSLEENSENGTVVGAVVASDPESDELTYSIAAGNELGGFALDASSGELTVADVTVLDFEINPSFALTVEVADAEFTAAATITINLTDIAENTAPQISAQSFSLEENSAAGTIVGTVVATDAEADILSFSINSRNDNNAFSISSSSGRIVVADASNLDFELNESFSLTVEVSDGSLTSDAIITIDLIDVDEIVLSSKNAQSELVIYPNPVNEVIHISGVKVVECELLDLLGRKMLHSGEQLIDVSKISSGVYLLEIITTESKFVKKIFIK